MPHGHNGGDDQRAVNENRSAGVQHDGNST
jgi:hypothetical protein